MEGMRHVRGVWGLPTPQPRSKAKQSKAVAILAQVDLPLLFLVGGGAGGRPSEAAGCSQQLWRVDVPLSGGRLESHTCRHFASEALWGR